MACELVSAVAVLIVFLLVCNPSLPSHARRGDDGGDEYVARDVQMLRQRYLRTTGLDILADRFQVVHGPPNCNPPRRPGFLMPDVCYRCSQWREGLVFSLGDSRSMWHPTLLFGRVRARKRLN